MSNEKFNLLQQMYDITRNINALLEGMFASSPQEAAEDAVPPENLNLKAVEELLSARLKLMQRIDENESLLKDTVVGPEEKEKNQELITLVQRIEERNMALVQNYLKTIKTKLSRIQDSKRALDYLRQSTKNTTGHMLNKST